MRISAAMSSMSGMRLAATGGHAFGGHARGSGAARFDQLAAHLFTPVVQGLPGGPDQGCVSTSAGSSAHPFAHAEQRAHTEALRCRLPPFRGLAPARCMRISVIGQHAAQHIALQGEDAGAVAVRANWRTSTEGGRLRTTTSCWPNRSVPQTGSAAKSG